ncbi:sphingomyelin phosphodiesterase, putative [Babesia caballi]|uniref:sphingomyelin phosphodiesterase n=1 Tax=Babesia caballi TaxID=5871 RepID=A0AAV4M0D6_BABCB|nr:sphingomyelin phosphodiesterase, putative [Babesia caballi]
MMAGLQPVTIMSYNVQGLPNLLLPVADLKSRIPSILLYLREVITKYHVDVLVFQELFSKKLYSKIKDALKDLVPSDTGLYMQTVCASFWMRFLGRLLRNFKFVASGVVIFSKYPITAKEKLVFSSGVFSDALSGKGAVAARIQVRGRYCDVVGTHLQAHEGPGPAAVRKAQAREIAEWFESLFENEAPNAPGAPKRLQIPRVLAGDFNVCNRNEKDDFDGIIAAFEGKFETTFGGKESQPTYTTKGNDFCSYQNGDTVYNHTYDFILKQPSTMLLAPQTVVMDPASAPVYIRTHNRLSYQSTKKKVSHVSDHNAIVATIGI